MSSFWIQLIQRSCTYFSTRLPPPSQPASTPPLLWPVRVRIAAQMSDALAYLHSLSIIHRDIKPANMFLDANLDAKLGDIGLAALDGRRAGEGQGGACSPGSRAPQAPTHAHTHSFSLSESNA
jgi:serine/threonine protein kinase